MGVKVVVSLVNYLPVILMKHRSLSKDNKKSALVAYSLDAQEIAGRLVSQGGFFSIGSPKVLRDKVS